MVDRSRGVWRVPAEDGAQGGHDLRVTMQLHRLQIGQHRAQVPLSNLGDLKVAVALGEAIGQQRDLVAMPRKFGLEVRKLQPLGVQSVVTTGDKRVTLYQSTVPLGNLSVQLG